MFANVHEPSQRNVTQKKKNIGMKNVFLSTDSLIQLYIFIKMRLHGMQAKKNFLNH